MLDDIPANRLSTSQLACAQRGRARRRSRPAHARRPPRILARRLCPQRARQRAPVASLSPGRPAAPQPRGRARARSLRQHGRHRRGEGVPQDRRWRRAPRGRPAAFVSAHARRARHRRLRHHPAQAAADAARHAGPGDDARGRAHRQAQGRRRYRHLPRAQGGPATVLASKSPNRHIILLTDGISQPHNYTGAAAASSKRDHIAVATVALGTRRRRRPAAQDRAGDRRQLLHDQARARPAEDLRQGDAPERQAGAGQRAASRCCRRPAARSCARSSGVKLPALSGNVVTQLRPGAQVDLIARSGSDDDRARARPVGLRHGARGLVDARASARPGRRAWTPQTALWNDAVRWVARGVPPAPASATARTRHVDVAPGRPGGRRPDAASPALSAVLERPGGTPSRISARTRAPPSIYTADVAALPAGSYELDARACRPRSAAAARARRCPLRGRVPADGARSRDARTARRADRRHAAGAGRSGALTGDRRALARRRCWCSRSRSSCLGRRAHARALAVQATRDRRVARVGEQQVERRPRRCALAGSATPSSRQLLAHGLAELARSARRTRRRSGRRASSRPCGRSRRRAARPGPRSVVSSSSAAIMWMRPAVRAHDGKRAQRRARARPAAHGRR